MKYRVKIEQTDEGYAVSCPGLPDLLVVMDRCLRIKHGVRS